MPSRYRLFIVVARLRFADIFVTKESPESYPNDTSAEAMARIYELGHLQMSQKRK